ncbi:hypothetical protein Tco_0581700 [Tanacetum coccineum]
MPDETIKPLLEDLSDDKLHFAFEEPLVNSGPLKLIRLLEAKPNPIRSRFDRKLQRGVLKLQVGKRDGRPKKFREEILHLIIKDRISVVKCCIVSLEDKARLTGEVYNTLCFKALDDAR